MVNAELHSYRQSLDAHCNTEFNFFCDIYAQYLPQGIKEGLNAKRGAVEQLDYLYKECYKAGQSIYLLWINTTISPIRFYPNPPCLDNYRSETHGTGYLRSFFDTVKAGTYMLSSVVL